MKKKLLFILVIVFLLLIYLFISSSLNNFLDDRIQTVKLENKQVDITYTIKAKVTSDLHYQFFIGSIKELFVKEKQMVNKDDSILSYIDQYDKTKTIKADFNGYIEEISDSYISIRDNNYYLEALVDNVVFNNISVNDEGYFYLNDKCYLTKVISKENVGSEINGKIYYKVILENNCEDLLDKQELFIKLKVNNIKGIVVDKNAIYHKDNYDYLILADYLNDINNLVKYILKVNIIYQNEEIAVIDNYQLENYEVCLIDSSVLEVLIND